MGEILFGPPGTGKTAKMIEKINQSNEDKRSFIFCSYTKAAAQEGLKRIGIKGNKDKARTIHSLAFEHGGVDKAQVVDRRKLMEFSDITGILITGKTTGEIDRGDQMMSLFGYANAKIIDPMDAYHDFSPPDFNFREFQYFIDTYTSWKNKWGYKDFHDMLIDFCKAPKIKIDDLFVDEAQDLSPMQWECIKHIDADRVIISGDPDQSVYSWSGADPHGMESYMKWRGLQHKSTVLRQSHRIPSEIHKLAKSIISNVVRRTPKEYRPREEKGRVIRANSMAAFEPYLDPKADKLFLYRNYSVKQDLEEYLIYRNIPYTTPTANHSMFTDKYANAVRAYEKIKDNQSVTKTEIKALERYVKIDYERISRIPWDVAINMPWENSRYLKGVDIFAEPKVRLSTIHGAKGAEADQVVLLTAMGHRTWENMATDPDAEWRVWYVGVTRARHDLFILNLNLGVNI